MGQRWEPPPDSTLIDILAAKFAIRQRLPGETPANQRYQKDLENSLQLMIINAQKERWGEEYAALKGGKPVKVTSDIHQLNPILSVDGVICMKTRLEYSQLLPEQTK